MKPVKIFLQPRRNFREASRAVLTIVSNSYSASPSCVARHVRSDRTRRNGRHENFQWSAKRIVRERHIDCGTLNSALDVFSLLVFFLSYSGMPSRASVQRGNFRRSVNFPRIKTAVEIYPCNKLEERRPLIREAWFTSLRLSSSGTHGILKTCHWFARVPRVLIIFVIRKSDRSGSFQRQRCRFKPGRLLYLRVLNFFNFIPLCGPRDEMEVAWLFMGRVSIYLLE